jgi:hypothetical protein
MHMDPVSRPQLAAQEKAETPFKEVIDKDLIQAGKLESELTAEIHSLARSRFGLYRPWNKRIARSGPTVISVDDCAACEFV